MYGVVLPLTLTILSAAVPASKRRLALLMMVIRSAQVPGQPRAQQLRAFLGTLDGNPAGCWGVREARLRLKPALGHPVMDCRPFG